MKTPAAHPASPADSNVDRIAYSIENAARALDASRSSIYRLIRAGHLQATRTPVGLRIKAESLQRLLSTT